MTSETYLRKANELKEKIKNTNPRFINKIAEMKKEEKRLRAKAKEKMEQERLKSTKATTEGEKTTCTMDVKSKDEVPWGQKYIFGYRPAVEYFKCPYCTESMHQNEALYKESGNIFIFQCKKCNRKAKVILNNVKCKYCNQYTIPSRLVREKYCSLACYEADNGIIRKTQEQENTPLSVNSCVYCKNGVCRNDENPYYYDQGCPGDCDYFYRR